MALLEIENRKGGFRGATLTRRAFSSLALAAVALPALSAEPTESDEVDVKTLVETAKPVSLPKDVVWETNNDEPLIGSPKAIRGGRLTLAINAYPTTFRLIGPNSTDFYAQWKRQFAMQDPWKGLVMMHPQTDAFIPIMATHWSVQNDQKTIYFKLDPDARWSDGHPVTATDYVFTWRMWLSKHIIDPFYNLSAKQYYESVDRIDDHTLRIVGTLPSWRPLYDYAFIYPTPAHATVVDKTWIERSNNEWPVVPGPYVMSAVERGESVTFKRIPNWWGDKKRYFTGLFNFDEIHLRVIQPERQIDYLRQGELDIIEELSAGTWNESYNFPAVTNGWLRRKRIFVDYPRGLLGLVLNIHAPFFQNRDVRIAMQYLTDFKRMNRNVMYDEYFRKSSFFDGTIFANPNLTAYPFDPAKALERMARAGYRKSHEAGGGFWGKAVSAARELLFTRTDTDDILVNDRGEKAQFVVMYYSKRNQAQLTLMQQDFRRAGVDMRLQLLEPGAAFNRTLERKYEAINLRMTSSYYPDPHQYLHSEFAEKKNNNNFWGFANKEVDDLIKVYEEGMDADARRDALWRIDQIVHDEAIYLPLWDSPYKRLAYWDYIQFPDFYLPKRTDQYEDWLTFWIDPAKKAKLQEAMAAGKAYAVDPELDADPYGVKEKFQ